MVTSYTAGQLPRNRATLRAHLLQAETDQGREGAEEGEGEGEGEGEEEGEREN